jgi:hypothetical protein
VDGRFKLPNQVILADFLGSEGRDDKHIRVSRRLRRHAVPAAEQLAAQFARPMAVVENHHRRMFHGSERLEKLCQGLDCAGLSDRFGRRVLGGPGVKYLLQFRQRGADRAGIDTDPASECRGVLRFRLGGGQHAAGNPLKDAEGILGDFDGCLAPKNPQAMLAGPVCGLRQQARFSAPRLAFQENQPAAAISRPLNLLIQLVEFRPAGYKGGLGQRVAAIASADHDRRVHSAAAEPLVDRLQIIEHGLRGLVAVSRVFSQEPLDDFVERPRNRQAELRESRHGAGHLFEEDRTDRITLERRFTREATVQDKPGGIEIGCFRHVLVDQSGLLR